MTQNDDAADDDTAARPDRDAVSPPPPTHRRHRRWPWVVAGIVLSPLILLALWTFAALGYAYSHGDRAGYVQKFSKKGWLCKTWEGELAMVTIPGTMPKEWTFSVRSDSLAQIITAAMGSRVSLAYQEHRGVPTSCFGETQYFVTGVRVLGQ